MAAARVILVAACAAVLSTGTQGASIFFPEEELAAPDPDPQLVFKSAPACAKNSIGLCSDVDIPYPTDLVKKALSTSNNAALTAITRGDEPLPGNVSIFSDSGALRSLGLPLTSFNQTTLESQLGVRFGGSVHDDSNLVEETAACTASESIIYPTMAENTQRDWLYVVNIEGVIVQGIRVEKCVDENKPCKIGDRGTVCRQKYIYRKLLAMDAKKQISADNFRIPSACVCYVKNEFLLGTRINSRNSTKSTSGKRRQRRQSPTQPELQVVGGETQGLSGSPLDNNLAGGAAQQGTAQQSIETEDTLNPSDTIGGQPVGRFAGEIIVHSNPIVVQKKPPKPSRRRN